MKTLIIDFNNLGWMAYGIVPLSFKGERVEVIYVGLNMIRSYLAKFEPNVCFIAIDGGRDPERLKLYPDYKRRRKELTMAELKERSNFFGQLKKLQETTISLGMVVYKMKSREADDVIHNLLDEEAECIVVSTDKDFYQLLGHKENVVVYNPVKKQIIRAKDVEEKFGIPINYFIDFKALAGDPSDRLPGIKGIGHKWAAWLVNNVLVEGPTYDKLTRGQIRAVNLLFDDLDTYDLMKKLIRLKHIRKEEMEKGRFEDRPASLAELQERGVAICQQYGFEKHQRSFPSFVRPFEMLWRKGE